MALPKPSKQPKPEERKVRPQFLRVGDLQGVRQRATILKLVVEETEYSDAILRLTINGKLYAMGLKFQSSNYEKLFSFFGDDENNWKDKQFDIEPVWSASLEDNVMSVVESLPAQPEPAEKDLAQRLTDKVKDKTAAAK